MNYTKAEVKKMLHAQRQACLFTYGKRPSNSTDLETYQAIAKTPLVKIEADV